LFHTPTSLASILGGKFLAVVACLSIQVAVLLAASSLLFGIHWGRPLTVLLVAAGLVVAAAGFGVMLMSFIKNSRQTGPIMAGVIVITGMLGGLLTTAIPNLPAGFDAVTRITPQGWALGGLKLALAGAGAGPAALPALVLLALGAAFLAIGVIRFQRRFA
jgi:ABC-2 type transport system permease protein